ncbi:MAG: CRTAC1 family protein [Gemmatimonadetes bacterium]|nr:CRTAC1 family protein [Gemmatimonadota bacterium]
MLKFFLLLPLLSVPLYANPRFYDATQGAGIDFVHFNGANGQKFVIETVGPGGGFFDYDGDGRLDIYLINGAAVPGTDYDPAPQNALYHNRGDGTFADVTAHAGVGDTGYGMGCAVGDIENDGDLDLYVTNFGANVLYRNEGDGTFADVTVAAQVGDEGWGASAAFADIDRDGLVDLYVGNYHNFSYTNHRVCAEGGSGLQLYCGPEAFDGVTDVLYRNEGDGTFADITTAAGLGSAEGKELGVVFGDVDLDGDPDLYLANDKTLNFLYLNDGTGHFADEALLAGVAYNEDGDVEAGMGVDMGDYDNDGDPDLFVTNFQWETNTRYITLGDGTFVDEPFLAGLCKGSIAYLSWGTRFFDVDNDGDRDLFIANGHLESDVEQYENATFPQRNQLFLNVGDGRFEEYAEDGGALSLKRVSRGAAFGDYDDDGDIDVLVANVAARPTLMRNDGASGHWVRLRLEGRDSNRAGIGTRVEVTSGGRVQTDEVRSGASYLSQSDVQLHFGLGTATGIERVVVYWPSGRVEEYADLGVNQEHLLVEGAAR